MAERSGVDVVSFMAGENLPPVHDLDLRQMTLLHYFKDVTVYESTKRKEKGGNNVYFGGRSGHAGAGTTGFAIFGNIVSKGGVVHLSTMNMVFDEASTGTGSHVRSEVCYPFYGLGVKVEFKPRLGGPPNPTYPFVLDAPVLVRLPFCAIFRFAHTMGVPLHLVPPLL